MNNFKVKMMYLLPTLLLVASLACTVQLTATTPTEIPASPIGMTVVPTEGVADITSLPVTAVPSQIPAATVPAAVPTQVPPTQVPAAVATQVPPTQVPATAIPTQVPPTQVPPTQLPPTPQPAFNPGTTVTYRPLTLVIPPEVANGASGSDYPRLDSDNAASWQKTPGHLQVNLGDYYKLQGKSHQPQIYVFPALGYAELVPAAFESIHRLDNILYGPGGPSLSADQLPMIPFINAQQVFTSNAQLISFQNGSGVRFLAEYAQYPASANNQDLVYTFQGVTRDGAYYIVAIFPVSMPLLAETSDPGAFLPYGGISYPYYADPNSDMRTYYNAVSSLLNGSSVQTFTPNLSQLDALIQSMLVNP